MKFKKLFLYSLPILLAISCHVTFVPAYNTTAIDLVKSGQELTTKFHKPENATYNDSAYVLYNSYIASLKTFDQSRANSKLLMPLIGRYQAAFNTLREQHKRKGTLSEVELKIHNDQLQAILTSILLVENNFKKQN